MAHLLVADLAARRAPRTLGNLCALSDRELLVFRRVGQKHGTTAIARELAVSVKTVETHQGRIKEKLGLTNSAELHQRAERWVAGARDAVPPGEGGTLRDEKRALSASPPHTSRVRRGNN